MHVSHWNSTVVHKIMPCSIKPTKCACSGPAAVKGVTWEPVCIKKKPAGMHIEKLESQKERAALEAVKQAMKDQPAPHCLSFLLDSYPAGFPHPYWPDDHQ